jgi:hypothetical protein
VTVSSNVDYNVVLDNFKQTYKPDLDDNRPLFTILQELLTPNREGIEMGAKVNIPVLLSHQGGETYGLSGDVGNLRNPVALEIKDASSDQFEITFPVRMPFGLISKATQSKSARFADKARLMLLAGDIGSKRGAELSLLHGQNSLGKVLSVGAVGGSGPYTLDVTFDVQSWSDGLWHSTDNLPYDFYTALTAGTKRNTNDCTVSLVKGWSNDTVVANRRTVTFTAAASTDLSAIATGDFVFSASAYGKQLPGLMWQLGLSSGATHLGISTNYSLWRPKKVTVSGPITFGKLLSGIAPILGAGVDGVLTVFASPANWSDLSKDLASARRADWSYKTEALKNGAKKIAFAYAMGDINIICHPFMKDGEVAVIQDETWFRAGSDPDPTMKIGDVNLQVMSSAANVIEWRFWSAQTLLPNCLATSVLFSGITPNPS